MFDEVHYWQLVRDDNGNIKTWRLRAINPAAQKSWGMTLEEVIGKTTEEIFSPNSRDLFMPIVNKIFSEGVPHTWETYFPDKDQYLKMTSVPLGDHFISTGVDITDLVKARKEAEEKEESLKFVLDVSELGYWDHDIQTNQTSRSLKHDQQFGYAEMLPEWHHETLLNHIVKEDRERVDRVYKKSVLSGGDYDVEFRCKWPDKKIHWLWCKGRFITNAKGDVIRSVGIQADITAKKYAGAKIEKLAFYDPLTKLPNRRLITERLKHALTNRKRSRDYGALLFVDLDHFKDLNDSLGHSIGDLLLQQVADRLRNCLRGVDSVGRLGGDEFLVLIDDLSQEKVTAASQVQVIANKVLSALNQAYQLDGYEYHNTPSIGVTLFGEHALKLDELLKQADIAMYKAKESGRNTVCFFDYKMQEEVYYRTKMDYDLRTAIQRNQFQLYYQVQVDDKGSPLGAEALIRWLHPSRDLVSPGDFIPIAEESDLILSIGLWVLDAACAQLKRWEKNPLKSALTLSVNISAKQFHQPHFVEQVLTAIKRHNINPNRLRLELTESMLVKDIDSIIASMTKLASIGIRFELDDFGTGYSSLQLLKKLPIDRLKIDQSFVRDIVHDSSDQAIVRTVIAMAESLGLGVIAEGVETKEQWLRLQKKGCKRYQGYLFSKPIPIEEFEDLIS
ncbi:diguanylate cyclase/phosphodiesterase with PAS/PAC and GAF sensor(s) [Glaciecola nitratireducens FR1064]|uniref:cyclic-guanylate-specific phosphodiesterase n=2 Tax=Brumicola TaxID=3160924 RepID=G4QF07_GLANF|nr:diguanylate cyclase/phosphodiesterase with PAS/PAC and GAF sensor(s) [Glaciecola nitratireducens FR1064]